MLVQKGADLTDGQLLADAIRSNMTELVTLLLDHGHDPNSQNLNIMSNDLPVTIAAEYGRVEILKLLLSRGADFNGSNIFQLTALGMIASAGNVEMGRLLRDFNADPNVGGMNGTPMSRALFHGHEELVLLLLERGADVNFINKQGSSCSEAALLGVKHVGLCRLLLSRGADPNLGEMCLPLIQASRSADIEIIKLLPEYKADPLARTCNGENALEYAVRSGSQDAVRLLLDHGADNHIRGGRYGSVLHAAVESGSNGMVRMLLDLGAEVVEENEKYGGLLHAAIHDHQLLVEHGANVNAPGKHGTPLQAAIVVLYRHEETVLETVTFLLHAGADVNKGGGRYGSPLQAAARCGLEAVTIKLLENGASSHSKGGRYGFALQAAAFKGDEAVVSALLEQGANVNERGGTYGTAIQAAAFGGHEAVVRLLLKSGADVGHTSTIRGSIIVVMCPDWVTAKERAMMIMETGSGSAKMERI